jgi:hypothetical protein
MTETKPTARVLIVANRTASTHVLLDEVKRRAASGAEFTVLVPPEKGHADDWSEELAGELLGRAAGGSVARLDPGPDALDTIQAQIDQGNFDELLVSTAPQHLARWVHHDLPHRLLHLGTPVTVIPPEPDAPIDADVAGVMHKDWPMAPMTGGGGEF